MNARFSILLWLFLASPGVLSAAPVYKAQKGDSYYVIAKRFNINYLELSRLNQNKTLRAGSSIRLPEVKTYRIQEGDTWSELALAFKTSLPELKNANPGKSLLKTGEVIHLPPNSFSGASRMPTVLAKPPQPIGNPNSMIANEAPRILSYQPHFVWPVSGSIRKGFGSDADIMNYGLL
ncbi:MAG: LysM peptidoglycan-binding domain-containing protein, partial [Spirochaetia bacterium]|nr:LysM peptidoglycan-binding domain-containing protein [Spirochaetia bacterium]